MEDIDLPLKVGRTRIGSGDDDEDDNDSTIFSDLANLRRNRSSNSSSANVSLPTRSATNLTATTTTTLGADTKTLSTEPTELDAGTPAVSEVEGDRPVAELAGSGPGDEEKEKAVELDARQTYVELPGDFQKKVDLKAAEAGAGAGAMDEKKGFDYGV